MNLAPTRPRTLFILLAASSVGALIASYAIGRHLFVTTTVLFPALLGTAWLSGRLRRWVVDWLPFLAWLAFFDALRGLVFALITYFDLPIYIDYAIRAERATLGGYIGPTVLQKAFYRGEIGWFEDLAAGVYASHFLLFLLFGMAIWLLKQEEFVRYCRVMLAMVYVGLLTYFVLPTVPPWMAASRFHAIPHVFAMAGAIYNTALPNLSAMFDLNPIAAMPSLHAAFPMACFLMAWSMIRWRAWPFALYASAVGFSTVYLGAHYVVDVIAGWALAGAAYWAFFRAPIGGRIARTMTLAIPEKLRLAWPNPMISVPLFALSAATGALTLALK